MSIVTLRRATMDDADALLLWRNEPSTVAVSQTQRTVTLEEHQLWLADVCARQIPVHLFIIEADGVGIGSCRIAGEMVRTSLGWLSINLTEQAQDHRHGWQALDLLIGEANRLAFAILKATIHRNNLPSRRIFSGKGFVIVSDPLADWLDYERML